MNILVTIDDHYLDPLLIMLFTLFRVYRPDPEQAPARKISVYLLHSHLSAEALAILRRQIEREGHYFYPIQLDDTKLADAPISQRYPKEIYYRLLAPDFLPADLDRVLYLDPDMIILHQLDDLYDLDLTDWLYAAATHIESRVISKVNQLRLDLDEDDSLINSGVMLMNLRKLRQEQDREAIFAYIKQNKAALLLPDQDIISALHAGQIKLIDPYIYNMTERLFAWRPHSEAWLNLQWVQQNSCIIHFCGRNKPWNKGYLGTLGSIYWAAVRAKIRA